MAQNDALKSVGAWALENGHRVLLALTGGRWPHNLANMPTLELHVTGRKTGQRRSTLLTAPIFEPDRIVVVASKGGHSEHPAWYVNLVANPDVEITVRGKTTPWTARTATAEERAKLWPEITGKYKNYAGYQAGTDREIPVVICTPR